jgi:ribosome-associated translation inhibitor RaiA
VQVQLNTDTHIEGTQALATHVEGVLQVALESLVDRITRVEVHLSDQNASKPGVDDKKCVMEARLAGRQPIAVSQRAQTVDQAIDAAAGKLFRALENALRDPQWA